MGRASVVRGCCVVGGRLVFPLSVAALSLEVSSSIKYGDFLTLRMLPCCTETNKFECDDIQYA